MAADSKLVALNRFNTTLSIESIVNAGGIVGVDGNVTYFTTHDSGETKLVTRNCDGEEVELRTYPSGALYNYVKMMPSFESNHTVRENKMIMTVK